MKAEHARNLFIVTTVAAVGFGVLQYMGKKKAIKAIQTAIDLPTLQKLYPVTASK